jgi:hypothetical protein
MTPDDFDQPGPRGTLGELVRRLRRMRWPEASPDARKRVWEKVTRQMEETPPEAAEPADDQRDPLQERRLRRHEFAGAVRAAGADRYSGALGARVAAARHGSRPMAFR